MTNEQAARLKRGARVAIYDFAHTCGWEGVCKDVRSRPRGDYVILIKFSGWKRSRAYSSNDVLVSPEWQKD